MEQTKYDYIGTFHNGFAAVEVNKKWNFIDRHKKLISDIWFDTCLDFDEEFAIIILNHKWNYINRQGKYH